MSGPLSARFLAIHAAASVVVVVFCRIALHEVYDVYTYHVSRKIIAITS